ncbi:hypothetical protein SAMN05216570_0143 [Dyella sp. OK004]|nr:hypothetical protein SAMN05216570_0143 [Dyella sp. OK004]
MGAQALVSLRSASAPKQTLAQFDLITDSEGPVDSIRLMPRRCWFLLAYLSLSIPLASHGACVDLSGPVDVPRHLTVAAEYASSKFVVLGRPTRTKNISSPDDPAGFDWTIYEVKVLAVYKGRPPRSVKLVSPNTTSRFPMVEGKDYLLFIEQSSEPEFAGKEPLPADFVDNCGNSGLASERSTAIRVTQSLKGRK